MLERIYSITEFNKILKQNIEGNPLFSNFFLKGELSGVTYYKSGHLYFNLKDKESQIKCVAFNYKFKHIPDDLKEGESVKIFCDAGYYETRGELQILVRHIEKENKLGDLFIALEKLKKELLAKGYFDEENKKPLTKYPKNIGVVTSATGAVFQDIIKTIRKRDPRINIYIYPAKVQGVGAKEEIVEGIRVLNKVDELDFIIVGRGGGSIEDLWCFNEREVAEAIYKSHKPIISAVGHETDNVLSDLVADVRAATPTQAVELSVPELKIIKRELSDKRKILVKEINNLFLGAYQYNENLKESYYLKNFVKKIESLSQDLVSLEQGLTRGIKNYIGTKEFDMKIQIEKLIGLNPMRILANGYSVTYDNKGEAVSEIKKLKVGDEIETRLKDGFVKSVIKELKKNEKK